MLDLIAVRRALHAIPELGFAEHETSAKIAEVLAEQTGLPYASTHEGRMHACGHDVHMACGLGILERILAEPREQSYVFLFQPAEEGGGGAKRFYDEGWLDEHPIDEFYALHVSPAFDTGVIATRHRTLFAGGTAVVVEFVGVPGHAATPHLTVDPLPAAAMFVLGVQTIVARNFDPAAGGIVITFGQLEAGSSPTIVALSAKVSGSIRYATPEEHDLAVKRLRELADGVALATGTQVNLQIVDSAYVPLINDEATTQKLMDWMSARDGVRFQEAPLTMTSEDFSYIAEHIPATMFWLGVGGDEPLHSDHFAPDEAAIVPTVEIVAEYLAQA